MHCWLTLLLEVRWCPWGRRKLLSHTRLCLLLLLERCLHAGRGWELLLHARLPLWRELLLHARLPLWRELLLHARLPLLWELLHARLGRCEWLLHSGHALHLVIEWRAELSGSLHPGRHSPRHPCHRFPARATESFLAAWLAGFARLFSLLQGLVRQHARLFLGLH
jgi:hypothetical protein